MSISINGISPNKKELANILRSVADWIESASNKTVTLNLDLRFNQEDKKVEV